MAGPWEEYQAPKAAAGKMPWEEYQAPPEVGPSESTPGALETGVAQAGNMLGFGYLPQIAARTQPIVDKVWNKITGDNVETGNYVQERDAIIGRMKEGEAANPGAALAGKLGGGVLSIASLPLPKLAGLGLGLKGAVARGAAYGGVMGAAGNPGDVEGDLNPIQLDQRIDNTVHGLLYGAGGGAVGKGLEKGFGMLAKSPQAATEFANAQAFKGSGAMLKDFRAAEARDEVQKVGEYMRKELGYGAGDTYGSIAKRAEGAKLAAEGKLSDVYGPADALFKAKGGGVGFDPIKDKAEVLRAAEAALGDARGARETVASLAKHLDDLGGKYGKSVPANEQERYAREIQEYLPKYKAFAKDRAAYRDGHGIAGTDPRQPAIPGMIDDLQRVEQKPLSVEVHGKPASTLKAEPAQPTQQSFLPDLPTGESEAMRLLDRAGEPQWSTVSRVGTRAGDQLAPAAQRDFLNQNTAEQISLFAKQGEMLGTELVPREFAKASMPGLIGKGGQTKMLLEPVAPQRPIAPSAPSSAVNPSLAKNIKGRFDDQVNYSRNPLSKEPNTEVAYSAARQVVSRKIDEAMEALGGEGLLAKLKEANRHYGMTKRVDDLATDRMSRESSNRMIGLTDTIAGGAAGTVGGGVAAMSGGDKSDMTQGTLIAGLLGALTNKAGRTYGPGLLSSAGGMASPALKYTAAPIGRVGERAADPAAIARILSEMVTQGRFDGPRVPREADKMISTPAMQKQKRNGQ